MSLVKQYRFFLVTSVAIAGLYLINQEAGLKAVSVVGFSFAELIKIIPPIFVLLGLLDVWVPKEVMVKYMGEGSGILGVILAFFLGSAAAGPLYGAFPVAAVFLKKGAKFSNVLIFIGAWSTTKIPMLLFELSALGVQFTLTRLVVDIIGIILIAYALSALVVAEERKEIYNRAENIG